MEQKVNTPRTITNIESARSFIHDVRLVENHLKNGGTLTLKLITKQMKVANLKGIGRVRDLHRFVEYINDNQYVDINSFQAA